MYGSFPPASEREARMDDPMIRSRLGRIKGTRPFGAPDPKRGPPLFFSSGQTFETEFAGCLQPLAPGALLFVSRFQPPQHGNSCLPEDVLDDGFAEARGVVIH